VAGTVLLLIGLGIFVLQILGVFKFKYVLNRMHAAAMGDTLGIGASLLGVILLSGFNFTSLKLALNEGTVDFPTQPVLTGNNYAALRAAG
jgi:multicomponent Na+:H+ antiporter subunit G